MRKKLLLSFCAMLLFNIAILAQTTATGKVVDEKGNGIAGASVLEKGTRNGTVTTSEGSYSIKVKQGAKLVVSAVGFGTKEFVAGTGVNTSLVADQESLNEIVVTGYQTLQKRAVTGSIATVKADQIKNAPIGSFDQMLQGQAAGTLIQANSGQPGAAANVIIRGIGSISGGTEPLYILDGVQISAQNFSSINPNDFETLNVLKDASATSQYGSRGANGVIVLTTKKGKAGKTKFEYNAQYGQSRFPTNQLVLMNTAQKLDYEIARGNPYGWSATDLDSLRKINTNWQDEITQTGITHNHQLSASGGNEKTTFFASLGLFNQSGTVVSTGLKRYNARLNLENKATDNLKFGFNSTVGWSNYTNTTEANTGIASPLNAVRWGNPYERKIDPTTGNYQLFVSGQPNPFLDITETFRRTNELKIIANAYLEANLPFIAKGLSFRTSWGVDYENWDQTNLFTRFSTVGQATTGNNGRYDKGNRLNTRYTGTTSLNYAKSFGSHTISVGYYNEFVNRIFNNFGYSGFGLTGNLQNGGGMTVSSTYLPQLSENRSENAILSNFVLANYSFKNRYFFNGSFRRDASSKFGENFRSANFYTVGAGWVISDESWFKKIKFVDNLKITTSYGTVGSQEGIGDFASRELFGGRTYNGLVGPGLSTLPDQNLTWEEREKFNIGFNATMFKGRVIFGFDFYSDVTNRLFFANQLSRTSGFATQTTNIGSVQNRGFEFTLVTQNVVTRDFNWSTNINFTINNNKVLALAPQTPAIGVVSGVGVTRVGLPLFSNFLVESVGVDPNTGDQLYKRPNGTITNVYNDAIDRQIFGTRLAPYFGGFTNKFTYKHIEASIFFSYSFGNQVYNNDRVNVEDPSYYWDNVSTALLTEWRKPGDITNIPRANQIMRRNQTRFLEDGSFIRLRNVQIAYNMPSKTAEKLKVRSIRMFIMGENLWTGFKLQAWDPELGTGGVLTGAQYPALRTFTGGITVGF
jgi:TonB-linked SusC/RagA family outer membrane protein